MKHTFPVTRKEEEETETLLGAELATAPSPNKYEIIERLEYLISLNRSAAPFAKEPLLIHLHPGP